MRLSFRSFCLLAALTAGAAASAARAETLTLDDCLREVARNNPMIEVQRARMRESLGTRLTLRSRALPRLGVAMQAGQQGDEGTSINNAGSVRGENGKDVLVAQQRVDRGSRLYAIGSGLFLQPLFDAAIPPSWRRGNLEVAIAEQNFLATASSQLYTARVQFYTAINARETERILREVGSRLDANTAAVSERLKAGLLGRQSLLQAQVQRSNYETPALAAAGNYETSLTALWALMGRQGPSSSRDPLKGVTLAGSLADAQTPSFDGAAVAREALERRPDLLSLRELVRAYGDDAQITRAGYYPVVQIIVTGTALPQNFIRSDRPNALRAGDEISTNEIRFGGRYTWTVVDTGLVQGSAQRLDRVRESLAISLRSLEQDIPRDLALLKAQSAKLSSQAEAYQGNAATARDTLGIVTDAVKQGTSSQLDVIDAESGLLNTQLGLLNVQWQTNIALAEFDRITGSYVRLVADTVPAAKRPQSQSSTDKN